MKYDRIKGSSEVGVVDRIFKDTFDSTYVNTKIILDDFSTVGIDSEVVTNQMLVIPDISNLAYDRDDSYILVIDRGYYNGELSNMSEEERKIIIEDAIRRGVFIRDSFMDGLSKNKDFMNSLLKRKRRMMGENALQFTPIEERQAQLLELVIKVSLLCTIVEGQLLGGYHNIFANKSASKVMGLLANVELNDDRIIPIMRTMMTNLEMISPTRAPALVLGIGIRLNERFQDLEVYDVPPIGGYNNALLTIIDRDNIDGEVVSVRIRPEDDIIESMNIRKSALPSRVIDVMSEYDRALAGISLMYNYRQKREIIDALYSCIKDIRALRSRYEHEQIVQDELDLLEDSINGTLAKLRSLDLVNRDAVVSLGIPKGYEG